MIKRANDFLFESKPIESKPSQKRQRRETGRTQELTDTYKKNREEAQMKAFLEQADYYILYNAPPAFRTPHGAAL